MELTITIIKPVESTEQAQQIYNLIKQKLTDYPNVKTYGRASERIELLNDTPPPEG